MLLANLGGRQGPAPYPALDHSQPSLPRSWDQHTLNTLHQLLNDWTAPEMLLGMGLGQVGAGLGKLMGLEAAMGLGLRGRAALWAARASGVVAESSAWTAVGQASAYLRQPGLYSPAPSELAQDWVGTAALVASLRLSHGVFSKGGPWTLGIGTYLGLIGSQTALGASGLAEAKPLPQLLRDSLVLLMACPVAGVAASKFWGSSLVNLEQAFQLRRFQVQIQTNVPPPRGARLELEAITPWQGAWSGAGGDVPKGSPIFKMAEHDNGPKRTPGGDKTLPMGSMRDVQERMSQVAARHNRGSIPPAPPATTGTAPAQAPSPAPKAPPSVPAPAPTAPVTPPNVSLRLISDLMELNGLLRSQINGSPKGFRLEVLLNRRAVIAANELMTVGKTFEASPLNSYLAIHDPYIRRSFLFDRRFMKVLGDRQVWTPPPAGTQRFLARSQLDLMKQLSFLRDFPPRGDDSLHFNVAGTWLPALHGEELVMFLNIQIPNPFQTIRVYQGPKFQEFRYDTRQGRWLKGPMSP